MADQESEFQAELGVHEPLPRAGEQRIGARTLSGGRASEMSDECSGLSDRFRRAASGVSGALGSPWAFIVALSLVVLWAFAGPFFGYSATWQLLINTGTTIATFLMLFILQNSQNRDTKAVNIKLDELLRAIEGARTGLANVDHLSDEELARLETQFRNLASKEPVI